MKLKKWRDCQKGYDKTWYNFSQELLKTITLFSLKPKWWKMQKEVKNGCKNNNCHFDVQKA